MSQVQGTDFAHDHMDKEGVLRLKSRGLTIIDDMEKLEEKVNLISFLQVYIA